MATFVLIPGAGSDPWYWHLVAPELERRGHEALAVDLPCDDDRAGLAEYTDAVCDQLRAHRSGLVLVAQSMAGFTAPLVCSRLTVELMVLVAAMVPRPGEAPKDWWSATGHEEAVRRQAELDGRPAGDVEDPVALFLHDVPAGVAAESADHVRPQSATPFEAPWPLPAWPDVPTRFLLCRHDRFFPPPFLRRVVAERLGIVADEMDGGHLPALAHPLELADRLDGYARGEGTGGGQG
jgi:hypothetical protein